jgi:hypothetical protein
MAVMRTPVPDLGQRALFVGKTGSGKTYAMLRLLGRYYRTRQIQILDTKGDSGIRRLAAPVAERLRDVPRWRWPQHPVVVYRPRAEELGSLETLDAWCLWIYDRGHTIAVVDEISQVADETRPGPGFLSMVTRGRDRDVSVWMATQRPRRIPAICYTEAEHYYIFWLADRRDRERVAEFTLPAVADPVPDPHGFWYVNASARNASYFPSVQ